MNKRKERVLSWDEYDELCQKLAHKVKDLPFDKIIGLSRGGLPIAGYFSKMFCIGDVDIIDPKQTHNIGRTLKNALIVDDIFYTGKTFMDIQCKYKLENCYLAALFKQGDDPRVFDCDYIYVEQTDDWIIFPIEKVLIKRKGNKDEQQTS